MNRLQKKCFIFSVSLHVLLLVVFLFGSAFFVSEEKPDNTRILHMISGKLVDDALSSGGNPNVQPVTQPPPAPAPPPVVESKPPEPKPKPAPEKAELPKLERPKIEPTHKTFTLPEKTKKPEKQVETVEDTKPKHEPKIDLKDLKLVKRNSSDASKAKDAAEAKAKAAADAQKRTMALNKVLNNWDKNLSPSAKIDFGPGGELFATNYRDAVASIYTAAWRPPDGFTDESATVTATVTIARDGKVINAHIIDRSGNSVMDRSIQRTLENVTFIAPFPEGAKDQERTFTIEFNLKAKHLLG